MLRFASTLVVCFGVASPMAAAQLTPFYPVDQNGLSLSDSDYRMLLDAANGLLHRQALAPGDIINWRNAQTGSSGTIAVTDAFERASMPCVTLTYATIPGGTPPGSNVVLNWCKTSDGAWKILS